MKYFTFVLSLFVSVSTFADAQQSILFSEKELEAAFTLIRPELNQLDISGRSGTLSPAPALKFLGVPELKFDINMGFIADVVDLEFNHIRNGQFQVQFQDKGLQITIPVEDQSRAIQSSVGSISFQNVTLTGFLGFKKQSNGEQRVVLKEILITGKMVGTGVLRGKLILKKTQQLLGGILEKQLNKLLEKDAVQEAVKKGLLTWSKFYTGNEFQSLVPGSMAIDHSGIHYSAQD